MIIMNLFDDYMKECEIFSDLKVPCSSKIVIRADGRNFSRLSQDLDLEKPYDPDFVNIMVDTCSEFFHEFNPSFMYTFSDEINILLHEIPFNGRVEKMNSVFASFISGTFSQKIMKNKKFAKRFHNSKTSIKPVSFDSRIIPLNPEGVVFYFKNRQDEAWRNCLNGYAYWTLRKDYGKKETIKLLDGKKSSQIQDMLFENGINIQNIPTWQRRGVGMYRKEVGVEGYNPLSQKKVQSKRWKAFQDCELPVFDVKFFKNNLIL
jgi:tRNA(His) guanylyltransferase